MRRLTILLATVGALLLIPAAQAFANGNLIVSAGGAGSGEVNGVGGSPTHEEEEVFSGNYETSPPVKCKYKGSTETTSGVCEAALNSTTTEGFEAGGFRVIPASGSEFTGYEFSENAFLNFCEFNPGNTSQEEEFAEKGFVPACFGATFEGGGNIEFTAFFAPCSEGSVQGSCLNTGPTNRAPLTLTKSAGGTGGIGTVSSKPKGINCATACNSAVASMFKNTPVTLKEKPATGSTFVEWTGACSGSAETCTVPMTEAESVGAVFGGVSKAIANPQPLTVDKGESSGFGTVKAAGLACEAECSSATVLYQGPTGVAPKNKPGKLVELKATAAYGSEFSGWSGACSGSEPVCKVTMEEAESVTAEFSAKPTTTLTVNKAGTGTGTVSSKPKAINCAATCTTQDASVPTGEAVILKEKPATGMTFEGWTGACVGAGETCTVSLSEAGTVTAKFGGAPKAIANAQELTLTKAGSGYGTVKAAGLTCEVLCTSTVSLFQGPTGIAPKNKPGKTVILKALSAPGSAQVEWSGCESNPTPTECSVVMEAAVEVTATFDELP